MVWSEFAFALFCNDVNWEYRSDIGNRSKIDYFSSTMGSIAHLVRVASFSGDRKQIQAQISDAEALLMIQGTHVYKQNLVMLHAGFPQIN